MTGAGTELAIMNVVWQWEQTVTPVDTTTVDDPTKYTLTLLPGGEYRFTADCNSGSGSYSLPEPSRISFEPGLMTMAECGPDSLSDQFLQELSASAIYFFQDGKLFLDMQYDSGTMRFGEALGIAPEQISLDTGKLPLSWHAVVVEATPYDESQPPGPKGLPEHIEILFGVSDVADREPGTPVMYIIPVDAYERLWKSGGSDAVSQAIEQIFQYTVVPPTHLHGGLPALPYEEFGGVNDLAVQVGRAVPYNELNETSAAKDGYRFVGRWVQDANPVTNQWQRYVFQGFTNDGKYLVSFWWPVRNPDLPDHGADVPADEMQKVTDDAQAYLQAKAEELNALPTSAWEPDLATLDAVVASLEIEEMPVSGLTDKVWWWMGSTAGSGSDEFTPVDDPSLYQAQYTSNETGPATGVIQYIADCNSGNMAYELYRGGMVGGMLAQYGPMTLAECGPESRYQEFVGGLQASQDYRVQPNGKTMVLVMPADGPKLLFVDSGRTAPATEAPDARPTPVPEVTAPPATPTPAPTPTPTPLPTSPPSAEISFTVDNGSIKQGECTTVRWKVENVKTVHVYPQGEPYDQYPVTGEGSQEVCPQTTTTYELRAELQSGEVVLQSVTVQVQAQEPQNPLANTNWELSAMYVNQVPIPGTFVSVYFSPDGTLRGAGSCNTYNGTYTVDGNKLSVGPLASTQKTCNDDVDAQEQAYLTALQSAATFEITGNQLVIRDAGGQEVLRYNSAQ